MPEIIIAGKVRAIGAPNYSAARLSEALNEEVHIVLCFY